MEIKDENINKNTIRIKYKNTDKNNKKINLFYSPKKYTIHKYFELKNFNFL